MKQECHRGALAWICPGREGSDLRAGIFFLKPATHDSVASYSISFLLLVDLSYNDGLLHAAINY
jgi:hypothetical protein